MQRPTTPIRPILGSHAGAAAALALTLPGDWVRHAACGPDTAELFFPISDTGPAAADIQRAQAICAACPVRQQCLNEADATGQGHGIWGGLTDTERAHRRHDTQESANTERLHRAEAA